MPTLLTYLLKQKTSKKILELTSQAHEKMINLKWVQQAFRGIINMYDRLKYSDKHVEPNGYVVH